MTIDGIPVIADPAVPATRAGRPAVFIGSLRAERIRLRIVAGHRLIRWFGRCPRCGWDILSFDMHLAHQYAMTHVRNHRAGLVL